MPAADLSCPFFCQKQKMSTVSVPESFEVVMEAFLRDMKVTFPEYTLVIEKYESKTVFLFLFCQKKYISLRSEILSGNEMIFEQDSTFDTEFLPRIVFKTFWHDESLSEQTKTSIWNYLRLILVSLESCAAAAADVEDDPSDMVNLDLEDEDEEEEEDEEWEDEDETLTKEEKEKNAPPQPPRFQIQEQEQEEGNGVPIFRPEEISNLENIFKTSFQEFSSSSLFREVFAQEVEVKGGGGDGGGAGAGEAAEEEEIKLKKESEEGEGEKKKNNLFTDASMDGMLEGIFGSSFLNMAKEIAEESMGSINPEEIKEKGIQGLFEQKDLFTNILSNLNTKLTSKMENGEFKEEDLVAQMQNIFSTFGADAPSPSSKKKNKKNGSASSPAAGENPFASLLQSTMSTLMKNGFNDILGGVGGGGGGGGAGDDEEALPTGDLSEEALSYFSKSSLHNENWYKRAKEEKIKTRLRKKLADMQKQNNKK